MGNLTPCCKKEGNSLFHKGWSLSLCIEGIHGFSETMSYLFYDKWFEFGLQILKEWNHLIA